MIAITYSTDFEGRIFANGVQIGRDNPAALKGASEEVRDLVRRANATPYFLGVLQWFEQQIEEGMADSPRQFIEEMRRRTQGALAVATMAKLTPVDPKNQPRDVNAELLAALESLTDWGREHTSPLQPNSPHDLLVQATAAIAKAKGAQQ